MIQEPRILAVTVRDKYLYAVSKAGHLLPLYYYGPLLDPRDAAPADGLRQPETWTQNVPFIEDWEAYARVFVKEYVPVPELSADVLPDDIEVHFSAQPRPEGSERPWAQAVYGGYPLYIFGSGEEPDPAGLEERDNPTLMFRQARRGMKHGPITGVDGGVGIPPTDLGP
ncbi:hypothetical protein [Deinococcus hohokamensis]|uniref:Uncharacterized protein n=1 Tax=Deinococcus hohokamensis TaxID=309883 RepID=A0ABV9IA07_9DEIO